VVALQRPSEEFGRLRRAWVDLLGGRGFDVPRWLRELEDGQARVVTVPLDGEQALLTVREMVRPSADGALFVCGWIGGEPHFRPVPEGLDRYERVTLLLDADRQGDLRAALDEAAEAEAGEAGSEAPPAAAGGG
jgi:hypothetical protein